MKNSFIYPIVFMMVVTVVFIAILASFNFKMADTIAFNQESELRQKILYIFDILPENDDPQEIKNIFDERVSQQNVNNTDVYVLTEGGNEVAYAVPVDGPGLWGKITGYVGLNKDYTKIIGIEFVTQSETPGLGGRIAENSYKEQYRNIDIQGISNGSYLDGVDAIAGATQTSAAVVRLVNEGLELFLLQGVK